MKQKKVEDKTVDAKTCKFSFDVDGIFYCRLKLFDDKVLQSSGIVARCDCVWYKARSN